MVRSAPPSSPTRSGPSSWGLTSAAPWWLELPRRRLKIHRAARRLRVPEDGADPDRAAEVLAEAGLAGASGEGLGTIGGGNHFCEVQGVEQVLDPEAAARIGLAEGDPRLLVHSGSRG
jgi:release factor H-coupled RctB family protein